VITGKAERKAVTWKAELPGPNKSPNAGAGGENAIKEIRKLP